MNVNECPLLAEKADIETESKSLPANGCFGGQSGRSALRPGLIQADFTHFSAIWWPELGRIGSQERFNGVDVSGQPKGDSVSCRAYSGPARVPETASIVASIKARGL